VSAAHSILCGRYQDAFERVGGAWRFADRLILSDLVGDLSRHLAGPGRAAELPGR